MKRTKELYQETLFATEDEKKRFENYNRWMNYHAQGPEPVMEPNVYDVTQHLKDLKEDTILEHDTI